MIAIGLMSGTSVDGVDAALVEIQNETFKLMKFITLPYDENIRKRILKCSNAETARVDEICSLNFELGYYFVDAIDELLKDTNLNYSDIEFVASHGQTIWHNPKQKGDLVASTLQIGESSVISVKTGIKTVANFRTADMVAGGEGAPLVPMSEYMIFSNMKKNIVLQNIGGISNLTYIPLNATIDDVVAFDCGPGNMMIDYLMKKLYNQPFDDGGKVANSGKVIKPLLDYLMANEFVSRIPPKSTGRELYTNEYIEEFYQKFDLSKYPSEDVICTVTEFTAESICYQYLNFIKDIDLAVVSGGGSHNKYILKRMSEILKKEVVTQEDIGYDSDAKEALAFVVLGYLSLNGRAGNVKSATGAKADVVLGNVTLSCEEKKKCQ